MGEEMNLRLLHLFFSIFLCFCACHKVEEHPSSYDLTSEERTWLEEFFTGAMLQDNAIYTLCGSKPMTRIILYNYTDEEIEAWYQQLSEEEKKTGVHVKEYDLWHNWEKWEEIRDRFPIHRYLFYRKNDLRDPRCASVYLVDPLKVACTLTEHYMVFRNIVGFDFDPLQEALNIEKGSVFWEKANNHATPIGLLFGYGVKNSSFFYWKHWEEFEDDGPINSLPSHGTECLKAGESSIEDLTLPGFVSFFEEDDVVEKYKMERKMIQRKYRGKDFLQLTLENLTGSTQPFFKPQELALDAKVHSKSAQAIATGDHTVAGNE